MFQKYKSHSSKQGIKITRNIYRAASYNTLVFPVCRAEWYVAHRAKAGICALTKGSHRSGCDSRTGTATTGAQIFSRCTSTYYYIGFGR